MSCIIYHISSIIYNISSIISIIYNISNMIYHLPSIIYHLSSIIYHVSSSVIYHLSNIIYQMSLFNVTIHLSIFVFFAGTAAFQLLLILLVYVSIKRIHGFIHGTSSKATRSQLGVPFESRACNPVELPKSQ